MDCSAIEPPYASQSGCRKAQYDTLVVELEKVQDLDLRRRIRDHETREELEAVSIQHKTLQEMTAIENLY